MVEIEIGVLARQCLDRRIDSFARLVAEYRRLGETAQCRPRPRQMDVHNRKSAGQNGARLSKPLSQIKPSSKSQNLCVEVLGVTPGTV
jgi:hypothetical protein